MDQQLTKDDIDNLGKTMFAKVVLTFAHHVLTQFDAYLKTLDKSEQLQSLAKLINVSFEDIPQSAGAMPIFGENYYTCIGFNNVSPPKPDFVDVELEKYNLCMENLRKLTTHYWAEYYENSPTLKIISGMFPDIGIDSLKEYDGVLKFHPDQSHGIVAYTYQKTQSNE